MAHSRDDRGDPGTSDDARRLAVRRADRAARCSFLHAVGVGNPGARRPGFADELGGATNPAREDDEPDAACCAVAAAPESPDAASSSVDPVE